MPVILPAGVRRRGQRLTENVLALADYAIAAEVAPYRQGMWRPAGGPSSGTGLEEEH